jgi:hypothetical protein
MPDGAADRQPAEEQLDLAEAYALLDIVRELTGQRCGLWSRGDLFWWTADGEVIGEEPQPLDRVIDDIRVSIYCLQNQRAAARISSASLPKSRGHRGRPRDSATERRRAALIEIVRQAQPCTTRQVFYLAETRELVPKTEAGYGMVQRDLVLLRRERRIPYSWITDATRWQRKPRSYNSIDDALAETARLYRRNLWNDADCYVEIWCEKDALSGVIYPVTAACDVPLMVARGYSSLSFLHSAAEFIAELQTPVWIYHLGDYDPSGQDAARAIEKDLREMAPEAEIHFTPLAVTPDQIEAWNLPTRPTKESDTRSRTFGSKISVELDAIEPEKLRRLVEVAIGIHLPADQLEILKVAEKSEREILLGLAGRAA